MSDQSHSPSDLLQCAAEAARAAGDHAVANADRRRDAVQTFQHDVKLVLDQECQAVATNVVQSGFPDTDILGEEDDEHTGETPPEGRLQWIIDPIDGTVNFSHGLPWWCSSVAVRAGATVLAGAVYAPALGELYAAACDGPATCNGEPITVSDTAAVNEAMLAAGLSQKHPDDRHMSILAALRSRVQKIRAMGAAALDMCNVAAGRMDLYWESGIYVWDAAAAGLIVARAGGRSEVLREFGGHRISYLASNSILHERFRGVLEEALSIHGG